MTKAIYKNGESEIEVIFDELHFQFIDSDPEERMEVYELQHF